MVITPRHTLVTGFPGCGKTTLVMRALGCLRDLRVGGFYTQELRGVDGRRVGFQAVGVNGGRTDLAHVRSVSTLRVGRYGVDLQGFEELIDDELAMDGDVDLFVVDEIGKMECYSRRFVALMQRIFENHTPLLATVAMKGGGFIQKVKTRADVELMTLTPANRDDLTEMLASRFRQRPQGKRP